MIWLSREQLKKKPDFGVQKSSSLIEEDTDNKEELVKVDKNILNT